MQRAAAEDLGREALIWIAARPDAAARFLAESGVEAAALRALAADAEFLAAVLDFLLGDEGRLLAFAGELAIDPALPARARAALPGGGLPNWT